MHVQESLKPLTIFSNTRIGFRRVLDVVVLEFDFDEKCGSEKVEAGERLFRGVVSAWHKLEADWMVPNFYQNDNLSCSN
jgi:hypothetical protein